jgi:hypothetical protein
MMTKEKLEAQAELHKLWWKHTEMWNANFQPRAEMRDLEKLYAEKLNDFIENWGHAPVTETNQHGHRFVPVYPYLERA